MLTPTESRLMEQLRNPPTEGRDLRRLISRGRLLLWWERRRLLEALSIIEKVFAIVVRKAEELGQEDIRKFWEEELRKVREARRRIRGIRVPPTSVEVGIIEERMRKLEEEREKIFLWLSDAVDWTRAIVEVSPQEAEKLVCYLAKRSETLRPLLLRRCEECGAEFVPSKPGHRFCNAKCRWRAASRRRRGLTSSREWIKL